NRTNGVPDGTTEADFARAGVSYTVTFNGAAPGFPPPQYPCETLIISGANNVTFAKNNLLPIAPSLAIGELIIGSDPSANATLNTSLLMSCNVAKIATGTLNVNGNSFNINSSNVTNPLFIGEGPGGTGTVNINGGGTVNVAGGNFFVGYDSGT